MDAMQAPPTGAAYDAITVGAARACKGDGLVYPNPAPGGAWGGAVALGDGLVYPNPAPRGTGRGVLTLRDAEEAFAYLESSRLAIESLLEMAMLARGEAGEAGV